MENKKINGGILLVRSLKNESLNYVFGLVGYQVSPIFSAASYEGINIYDVRHEQAAVHMADGYTNVTGKPGVAIVIGGPGLTNSLTGIIKAYMSHTPMLVIIGAHDTRKKDVGGLQDMDQLSIVRPYTKWCGSVTVTERIPEYVSIAMRHITTGRRGPAVLEIPINILRQEVDLNTIVWPNQNYRTDAKIYGDPQKISEAISLIKKSKRPILIAGNGIFYTGGENKLKNFIEYSGIPLYTTNAGRGVLPDDHKLAFGIGRCLESGPPMKAFKEADLIIVLGSTLDYTFFSARPPVFGVQQKFIQIDIEPETIGSNSRVIDTGIIGHSDIVIEQMYRELSDQNEAWDGERFLPWVSELRENEKLFWSDLEKEADGNQTSIHPYELLKQMNELLPREAIVVRDGSNSLLWAGLMLKCYNSGYHIIGPSGTFGPMGTGLPLALGAKSAKRDTPVLLYTGDGSFGFNIMEIDTAIRHSLPVIIIIHNDQSWGFCRDTQKTIFADDKSDFGTHLGQIRYDKIVESMGGHGEFITNKSEIKPALERALASGTVACINVQVNQSAMSPGTRLLNDAVKKI